jgi:DNA topoisomerase-3
MVQVCEGIKTKDEMLVQSIEQYKDMYVMAKRDFHKVIEVNLFALLFFLSSDMTVLQSVRRYIEGAGARNAGNGEGNGGPGRGGGGGAPRSRGRGRGNDRGDSDDGDGDGAPPTGGRSRGRGDGAAPHALGRAPPPPRNADGKPYSLSLPEGHRITPDIGPPQQKPRSSLRETAPRAGPSNHSSSGRSPKCDCGIPASKKRVTQKSAREGKQFYACAQDACGFFEWIEGEHDEEGQGSTGPTPLIPAKRTIGAIRSVSDIHLSFKIPRRNSDEIRIKPWYQRVNAGVRRTLFNVRLQRRGPTKGVSFGGVQKEGMKDVISLSGMMSPPRHLDWDLRYRCRREQLATTTLIPVENASRRVTLGM